MAYNPVQERNQDATLYIGNLDEKVNEALVWELMVQAGPLANVHLPKDRVSGQHQGYGFIEFMSESDADYALKIMNMIKLFNKPIRVNKAAAHTKNIDIGANIFIGNLDPEVDEKLLYDTFSAFGVIMQTPKIMRDPETGQSKGFAFVNYASFEASDAAIAAMNGQFLANRAISVSYAFKKDAKGERHGGHAERLLAAQNPLVKQDRPHQLFSDAPSNEPMPLPMPPVLLPMGSNVGFMAGGMIRPGSAAAVMGMGGMPGIRPALPPHLMPVHQPGMPPHMFQTPPPPPEHMAAMFPPPAMLMPPHGLLPHHAVNGVSDGAGMPPPPPPSSMPPGILDMRYHQPPPGAGLMPPPPPLGPPPSSAPPPPAPPAYAGVPPPPPPPPPPSGDDMPDDNY